MTREVPLTRSVAACTACLFMACVTGPNPRPQATTPNIVLMVVDDLRADALGFAGHPFSQTPNIDRLADEGMTFENAFVVQSVCAPSRATILTGRYARDHGVRHNLTPLAQDQRTVGHVLQDAGYQTAFIGKWHLGNERRPRAEFDFWATLEGQGTYRDPVLHVQGTRQRPEGHSTNALTDMAASYLTAVGSEPFFMLLSFKAVHEPFDAPDRHSGAYAGQTIQLPPTFGQPPPGKPSYVASRAYPSSTRLKGLVRRYYETLRGVDDAVAQIRSQLDSMNVLDNTMIILTSDNGFMLGEHGMFDKRAAYEASIQVPMVIRYPPWFAAGSRSEALALNLDILPTIRAAAKLATDPVLPGQSLHDLANNPEQRPFFRYEYFEDTVWPLTPTIDAIRTARFKFIRNQRNGGFEELYDLAEDAGEVTNLIGNPAYRDVRNTLNRQLDSLLAGVN